VPAFLETLASDFRYAHRSLMTMRGFTAVGVLTLSVGIGVNTAILAVADPMLLRGLPYPDGNSLVALRSTNLAAGLPDERTSLANLHDWQSQARLFEAIAGYRWRSADLVGGDRSERLRGLLVTPEYFQVFRVTDVIGRTLARQDQIPGAQPSILLGSGTWRGRFAANRNIVGALLDVNTLNLARVGPTRRLVTGVVTRDVNFPPLTADFQLHVAGIDAQVEFWMPETIPANPNRSDRVLEVVGRLKPGVTIAQAQGEMDAIAERLEREYPASNRGWAVRLVPLRSQILGDTRRVVLLLSLCSGVVLLIACVNVTTLQLARGIARRRDAAIQIALGASRVRIFRQMLVESWLLAVMGAAVALVLTAWGMPALRAAVPSGIPFIASAGLSLRVVTLTLAVSTIAALCISFVPAAHVWSPNAAGFISAEGRGLAPDRRRHRALGGLIALEVALTLMLLVAFGLMIRSAANVLRATPGFDPNGLLTMTISLPINKFDWAHNVVFSRQVMASVASLGEVESAAVVQGVPMRTGGFFTWFLADNGQPPPENFPIAHVRVVSPGYFHVMRIPLVAGSEFDQRDEAGEIGNTPRVIVSEGLARRYFPGADVIGRRIRNVYERWSTIVGVAADVRYGSMDRDPDPEIYLPEALFPQAAITLVARTRADPATAAGVIRARISQIDQDAFVTDVEPMTALMWQSVAERRLSTLLFSVFAYLALCLAVTGIYSVINQAVIQRRLEIAIRMALGAAPESIVRLIVSHAFLPSLAGVAAGAAASIALARTLSTMLFEVGSSDPATWLTVITVTIATCLTASYLPARRARRVEPAAALRSL
jgi:putative ABC transport system permease protein